MILKIAIASSVFVVGMVAIRKYREHCWGKCKSKKSIKGKIVIVTGANCGLGKATALELAKRGAKVILACRDIEKGHKAMIEIRSKANTGTLKVMELDLASFESIKKFTDDIIKSEDRLDILINNAGIFQCPYMTTKEGFEMQFGVNHLGHFLLTKLLLEKLKQSAPSRVIIVSSSLYKKGIVDYENFNSREKYDKSMSYKNSKLANVLFGQELSKRLVNTGVSVYNISPGMVWTNLGRHLSIGWWKMAILAPIAWLFIRTLHQGAQTILYCAISEEVEKENGLFYRNCSTEPYASNAQDDDTAKKLWEMSDKLCDKAIKID